MRLRSLAGSCAAALAIAGAAAGAGPSVTIFANHSVAEDTVPLLLRGAVSSGERGQVVTIEQDDCGPVPWHPLRDVRTGDGGGWVSYANGEQNFRVRARWHNTVSRAITIGVRPEVTIAGTSGSLRIVIRAYDWFGGKTAELQRLGGGRWRPVATTTLVKQAAAGQFARTVGTFAKHVPRGVYRALLPARSAAPCYISGVSPALRL